MEKGIVTLYVFGRVSLCMYAYMYVIYVDKKWAVWGLKTGKSPVTVIYCSLVEFDGQNYTRQFVQENNFEPFLLTTWE